MYIFKVHGKEYKVRFTYRSICEGDILDKVMGITEFDDATPKSMINKITKTTAELLLVGLQKYHKDEFGYDDEESKSQRIEDMLDLFDDYEDESTEEHKQSASTLLNDLQEELQRNGFLSAMLATAAEAEKAEQIAEKTLDEMKNEPTRTKVIDMTPSESKS